VVRAAERTLCLGGSRRRGRVRFLHSWQALGRRGLRQADRPGDGCWRCPQHRGDRLARKVILFAMRPRWPLGRGQQVHRPAPAISRAGHGVLCLRAHRRCSPRRPRASVAGSADPGGGVATLVGTAQPLPNSVVRTNNGPDHKQPPSRTTAGSTPRGTSAICAAGEQAGAGPPPPPPLITVKKDRLPPKKKDGPRRLLGGALLEHGVNAGGMRREPSAQTQPTPEKPPRIPPRRGEHGLPSPAQAEIPASPRRPQEVACRRPARAPKRICGPDQLARVARHKNDDRGGHHPHSVRGDEHRLGCRKAGASTRCACTRRPGTRRLKTPHRLRVSCARAICAARGGGCCPG